MGWNYLSGGLDILFYGIPITTTTFLYIKSPKLQDKFFFHYEFKASAYAGIISATLYMISTGTAFFINTFIGLIMVSVVGQLTFSIKSLISTHLIVHKIMKMNVVRPHIQNMNRMKSKSTTEIENQIQMQIIKLELHSSVSNEAAGINLRLIFYKEDYLHLFAQHLFSEFTIESLLSYIELSQYKTLFYEYIYSKINPNSERKWKPFEINLTTLEYIPKSNIVYNTFKLDDTKQDKIKYFKQIASLLHKKYIEYGSKYEINISSRLKIHYNHLFKTNYNITTDDMYILFDKSSHEMYKFLDESALRFKKTNAL